MVETLSYLGLGFLLGLKHALDADHLIAVATIVNERKGIRHASMIGALWGLGHILALVIAGTLVLGLRLQIPDNVASIIELLVAMTLIVLGVQLLWKVHRGAILHIHAHEHDNHVHIHPHIHDQGAASHAHRNSNIVHHHGQAVNKKPFFIGLLHGMAGSASLLLMTVATIPSLSFGLLYIGMFGIGSLGGMVVMSILMSLPFSLMNKNFRNVAHTLSTITGLVSVGFGILLTLQIGVQLF